MTNFLEESPGERSSSRLINIGAFVVVSIATLWAALAGQWDAVQILAGIVAAQGTSSYVGGKLKS